MSHSLFVHFRPAIDVKYLHGYFTSRKNFQYDGHEIAYRNEETGAYFFIHLTPSRNFWRKRVIASAEIEVNYSRPSFFALEAEIEISAFVNSFRPRIEDPQIDGMGDGPYSSEGYLKGWNFGNDFSARGVCLKPHEFRIMSLPGDLLRAHWQWNYDRRRRMDRLRGMQFVPLIKYVAMEDRVRSIVIWGEGMPVVLPKVDYVLVGKSSEPPPTSGLAPWAEVAAIIGQAGFDPMQDPIDLRYRVTPDPIAAWVAGIAEIDGRALAWTDPYRIVDDEVLEAAREAVGRRP